MEIILKQDVDTIGNKDQIVNVKPGYANNFLIPQGFAIAATVSAKKVLAENIKQQSHKEAKRVADATIVANKLASLNVAISSKASEGGKLFGAVTSGDVAEQIAKLGVDVDKRDVKIENIKEVGSYTAIIKVYKDIKAEVNVIISAE